MKNFLFLSIKTKNYYLPCFIPALDLVVPGWKVIPPYGGKP